MTKQTRISHKLLMALRGHACRRVAGLALAVFGPLAALAAPVDVYVTPTGAGDKDGRDWENAMSNISDAYASCAANADGGTVHLAGGIYRSTGWDAANGNFTAVTAFTPANDVTLAGSTDPANPTIITGDRTLDNTWEGGSPQWADGAIQLPPEDACVRPVPAGANDTGFLVATAAATNCVFRDLTIHGFGSTAIDLTGAENVRFLSCRFVGIGHANAHPEGSCIILKHAAGVVSNCLFVGYNNGVKVLSTDAKSFQIMDSHFRSGYNIGAHNKANDAVCPGVCVQQAAVPTISGCTFEHLTAMMQNFCFSGSAPWATFTNSVISHCVVNAGSLSVDSANIRATSTTSLSLVGCRLSNNVVQTDSGGWYVTAACLRLENGNLIMRDCSFIGNKLEQQSGGAGGYCMASIAGIANFRSFQVLNCAFVSNAVNVAAEGAPVCTFGGWRPQQSTFANCVFRDNDCKSGGARFPEFESIYLGHADNSPIFVNTVIWNAADDYVPLNFDNGTSTGNVGIASCIIKGFAPPAAASGNGFQYGVLDDDPCFAEKDAADGILSTPKLTGESPLLARKGAVKVCQGTDGMFYFLDTNKSPNVWRKLGIVNAGSLSLEDGAAIGLDVAGPAIPDIFGNARDAESPIGPYYAFDKSSGLLIFVR